MSIEPYLLTAEVLIKIAFSFLPMGIVGIAALYLVDKIEDFKN
jgi:hypothetical protein